VSMGAEERPKAPPRVQSPYQRSNIPRKDNNPTRDDTPPMLEPMSGPILQSQPSKHVEAL
jgi:hypothetical protein